MVGICKIDEMILLGCRCEACDYKKSEPPCEKIYKHLYALPKEARDLLKKTITRQLNN